MTNALKPCPFCGQAAKIQERSESTYIWCGNSDCTVRPDVEGPSFEMDNHCVETIAAWNHRVADPAHEALVEALTWVRANYAAGSTKDINARIDAALALAGAQQ